MRQAGKAGGEGGRGEGGGGEREGGRGVGRVMEGAGQ